MLVSGCLMEPAPDPPSGLQMIGLSPDGTPVVIES